MVNRVVAADWNQAMLGAVVKFGSCNELTVDRIHHLNTSMQFKTVWCFQTAVVDALQDDTLSANQSCSPFGASTRLQARGHVYQ